MKKAVLATFGTLGDIYPFIAIAHILKARSIFPVIAAPEMHRKAIESEDIAFASLRPDVPDALGADLSVAFQTMLNNPHFILDEIYMRFLAETYEDVMRVGADAHVILSHSLLVGAHQAAEKLGHPSARVALAPLHLQSAASPSLTPSAPYILEPSNCAARDYNRVVRSIVRLSVNARMGRLRAFRREIGLPQTREDFFLDFGQPNTADAIFGLFSPRFAPPPADQPANINTPGFPFFKPADADRRELDAGLQAFLRTGEAPIIFTLGSFAPEVSSGFYDRSIRAARALGQRAVLLVGTRDAPRLAALAGPNEHVCAQAPHSLLFPLALCVVHHGGIGTTAEALRAGKPQIIVPFFGDQPDHGARIERLGLGFSIKLSDYDENRATNALRALLAGDHAARAQRFADEIADEKGVEAVADWVERVTCREELSQTKKSA